MIFNTISPALIWFLAWRKQVERMKTHPEECDFLCHSAAVAQAQFVMHQALENQGNYL